MVSVVLMGAGASYGSGDATPEPPPLGKDLFRNLEQEQGIAAKLPVSLKALFHENFETGMAELHSSTRGDVSPFQRELARYLAKFTPGANNVYVKLIRELGIHRVIYSSLNYDLLFELSAARLGLSTYYGSQRFQGQVRLLKIHGSSNVWPDLQSNRFIDFKISNCAVDFEGKTMVLNQQQTLDRCITERMLAPSMAIYSIGKTVKVCPNWVKQQQDEWRNSVGKAKNIFIVGVRVMPADQHIWGLLAECAGNVIYYGVTEQDSVEFGQWMKDSGKKNARFIRATFSESVIWMRKTLKGR